MIPSKWILTPMCLSGRHCIICRNKSNPAFRDSAIKHFEVPGNVQDFDCPYGVSWEAQEPITRTILPIVWHPNMGDRTIPNCQTCGNSLSATFSGIPSDNEKITSLNSTYDLSLLSPCRWGIEQDNVVVIVFYHYNEKFWKASLRQNKRLVVEFTKQDNDYHPEGIYIPTTGPNVGGSCVIS